MSSACYSMQKEISQCTQDIAAVCIFFAVTSNTKLDCSSNVSALLWWNQIWAPSWPRHRYSRFAPDTKTFRLGCRTPRFHRLVGRNKEGILISVFCGADNAADVSDCINIASPTCAAGFLKIIVSATQLNPGVQIYLQGRGPQARRSWIARRTRCLTQIRCELILYFWAGTNNSLNSVHVWYTRAE